jgi:ribose transport system ATP-binding protein
MAPAESKLLEIKNVYKAYPGVQALDDVSFSVARGEVHALLGANGAGKSTMIKILAGAVPRDSGEILIDGESVQLENPQVAARLGIACIFQEPALIPLLTVEQNIFLGKEITNQAGMISSSAQRKRARELLEPLAPYIKTGQQVIALRTSERQLVALARALLAGDKLVIMDEPSASMTEAELHALFAAIGRLKAEGVSVIYVTHRLEEVFQIADTVTVLRDGKHIHTGPINELTRPQLVNMIVGREVRVEARRRDIEIGRELLRVRGLTRDLVFEDISFDVRAGEVVALAGLVGAGRSEIMRAVLGADPYDSGTIQYPRDGVKVSSPARAVRASVVMIPEDRKNQGIIPQMSVADNLILSSIWRYVHKYVGLVQSSRVSRAIAENVRKLDIRPPGAENRAIETLSGGNQQKTLLARAMESGADLLILDEPTAGVDVGTKAEIYRWIVDLASEGRGILLISSEIEELLTLADRILVIRQGRLVGEINGQSATSHDIHRLALGEEVELDRS